MPQSEFINRELSWLSFNARVLQEAADPTVPLIERIKFLGIFSSNLDEFFRVRVATMKRLIKLKHKGRLPDEIGYDPEQTLHDIQQVVTRQQTLFEEVYKHVFEELRTYNIFIIDKEDLTEKQEKFVQTYYHQKVRPSLVPLMLDQFTRVPSLDQDALYLAVYLEKRVAARKIKKYALAEVPIKEFSRFVLLPSTAGQVKMILLENVFRYGIKHTFSVFKKFKLDVLDAYPIKITKDAELDIEEDDLTTSFAERISESIKQRTKGQPVRFVYDKRMPADFLKFLTKRLGFTGRDTILSEGRYLNFKDFIKFPRVGADDMKYPPVAPLLHKDLPPQQNLLKAIRKRDILLHYPYQSFQYVVDLLREAAIDPKVTSIRMTLYRVAEISKIVNALSKAAKNGKAVTVLFEFQARFDEEANLKWANLLVEDGVRVIQGIPELKVHAKLCLIARKERGKTVRYAAIGTGNYNEDSAKIYGDHTLLTADERITSEVRGLFTFLRSNYKVKTYSHLVVSPFTMRTQWLALIKQEIANAKAGQAAYIILKMNSLSDRKMIEALYQASQAGVNIRLIIRGICSLVAGIPGISDHIEAISILDKYLEHSRIFVFGNGGTPKYYLSSADWMTRNLDHRVEVACPIYDPEIQRELQTYLDLQWRDNAKARILDQAQDNRYKRDSSREPVRSQDAIYQYLKEALKASQPPETGAIE